MNIFRLAGDMTHLLSIVLLLHKITGTRSCRGISMKTQELYAIVFISRYLDLLTNFTSLYNSVMKMVFIATSISIIYLMRRHKTIRASYDRDHDTFRYQFLVIPSFILALIGNKKFTFMEVTWAFSLYLEAIAILPQLVLLQRTQNIDNLTGNYVFLLGTYRAFYLLNWVYRYFSEPHYRDRIAWIAGLVQTVLYADFFYYYLRSWKNNRKLSLPA